MKVIIGPTRPVWGSPAAFVPNPPIPSTGVKPFSMKNAVMKPQAMKAAMFGMIIPERNVPNFWIATRAPPGRLVCGDVVVIMLPLSWSRRGGARRRDVGCGGHGRLLGFGRSL